ncbi:hypothetical protein JCM10213v2_006454 [Rhodosporidiobolus nylandii]
MLLPSAALPPGRDAVLAYPPARSLDWLVVATFYAGWLLIAYVAYRDAKNLHSETRRTLMQVAFWIAVSVAAAVALFSATSALPASAGRLFRAVDRAFVGLLMLGAVVEVVDCLRKQPNSPALPPATPQTSPTPSTLAPPPAPSPRTPKHLLLRLIYDLERANEQYLEKSKHTSACPAGEAWDRWVILSKQAEQAEQELCLLLRQSAEALQAVHLHLTVLYKQQEDSASRFAQALSQVLVHLDTELKPVQVTDTGAEEAASSCSLSPPPSTAVPLLDALKLFAEQSAVANPSDPAHAARTIELVWPLREARRACVKQERMLHRAILDFVLEWNAERQAEARSGL